MSFKEFIRPTTGKIILTLTILVIVYCSMSVICAVSECNIYTGPGNYSNYAILTQCCAKVTLIKLIIEYIVVIAIAYILSLIIVFIVKKYLNHQHPKTKNEIHCEKRPSILAF
jgi:ABC-type multidrug transport system permease subunit